MQADFGIQIPPPAVSDLSTGTCRVYGAGSAEPGLIEFWDWWVGGNFLRKRRIHQRRRFCISMYMHAYLWNIRFSSWHSATLPSGSVGRNHHDWLRLVAAESESLLDLTFRGAPLKNCFRGREVFSATKFPHRTQSKVEHERDRKSVV